MVEEMLIPKKTTCAFTGHRPEKLTLSMEEIENRLEAEIRKAIKDGYKTFINGAQRGVDLYAAMVVLELEKEFPEISLITAIPFEGFDRNFEAVWKNRLNKAIRESAETITISKNVGKAGFWERDDWMVDHASRLIAFYNGSGGGTKHTIEYAKKQGVEVVQIAGMQAANRRELM